MQAIVVHRDVSPALAETRKTLLDGARRRFGALPGEVLVEHLLEMAGGADHAVREAALEALRRRWDFARRDELRVAERPASGVLGAYTTARAGRGRAKPGQQRPYTSVLESVAPIRGSCDCPDFVRSSLGLCKHLLVVLEHVFSNRRLVAKAAKEGIARRDGPRLEWDPRLPLTGALDRLAGLRLLGESRRSGPRLRNRLEALEELARAFPDASPDPELLGDPERRRALLRSLMRATAPERRARPLLAASPAARAILREELDRAERFARNRTAERAALSELGSLERKLYPYQREGVERFLRSGRLLLADDMGLGKTTQAIAACHALFRTRRVRRGLVIVPASLKPQWLREWQDTTRVPAAIVDGAPEERARQYRQLSEGFLIIGYEQLLRDFEHVQRLAPEMVVLDEAQRIKNYATKSAAYVKTLDPEFRLVLTGTPMENRLEELASLLDWVDDVALAPKWRLVPWYTAWQGDGGTGKAGARNLDTLRRRMAGCVVRRVRREVLAQLPSRTDTRVPVAMTPQQRDEHDALTQPIAKLVAIAKRRPLLQREFLKLMQLLTQQRIISNGLGQVRFEELWPAYSGAHPDAALLEGLFAPKLGELRRLIADLVVEQERRVVVFSQWRRMLRLAEWSVRDVLGAAGFRAVFFTGAEKPAQRTRSIVDFHDDSRARVMFLSDAGGVGLNLQRAANACINLEMPWNPAVLEQRIGRIYRLGQKQPIDVFNLVSETGIESRIAELVGTKQALFSGLFDGKCDEVRFDGAASFLTRVERILDPGALPEPPAGVSEHADGLDADDSEEDAGHELPSVRQLQLHAANGSAEHAAPAAPAAPADSVASLFQSLRVERTPDGGVRLEAPPEAAGSLVALFEGMARLLSGRAEKR